MITFKKSLKLNFNEIKLLPIYCRLPKTLKWMLAQVYYEKYRRGKTKQKILLANAMCIAVETKKTTAF
jgi:hypothetical protein